MGEFPTSLEAVVCIALFVVPGYIALSVSNMLAPRFCNDSLHNVLRCFTYSLVLCALLAGPFAFVNGRLSGLRFWMACVAVVVLGGVISGLVIGAVRKVNLFRKLAEKLGLNANSSASPWDFKFSQINEAKWIRATLVDGREIYGLYSNGSDASSVADVGAGVFLEKTCDRNWVVTTISDGVFIPYASISTIEFFNGETGDVNEAEAE